MKKFIVFGSPRIEAGEIKEAVKSFRSGWIGTGPKVARFENDFIEYKNAKHGAAVNSCTAALHLSMLALGVKPGDEIITTPLTFCATVNAIIHAGAVPVLADIDGKSMNIDPGRIAEKITRKTRAIIPVHFAGRPCDMNPIMALARRHGLQVIEDCAHAIEAEYQGRPVGTIGDFGCFSFYVTKNITTGEGGLVIAKRRSDIEKIKVLALHGMDKDAWHRHRDRGFKHYRVTRCGFKYNMTDIQASLGIHQLKRIERLWKRRREIWRRYDEAFRGLAIQTPSDAASPDRHAYHLYTILVYRKRTGMSRDQFIDEMTRRKIGVGVHYLSLPEHPFYRSAFKWRPRDYPNAAYVGATTVSLPLSPSLEDSDVERVIGAVEKILGR